MKVLYSGDSGCELKTLKRLVLLADEIGFMDRPSVTFDNFGTVGHGTFARGFPIIDSSPVVFSVHTPPSGPILPLYRKYLDTDLKNPAFVRLVLEGLGNDERFKRRLIDPQANYGWGNGQQIIDTLLRDETLLDSKLTLEQKVGELYVPDTPEGRQRTLTMLLLEASIHVSNAMVVGGSTSLNLVTDDPYFCRLLAMRTSGTQYVNEVTHHAPTLALAVSRAVISDAMLAHLDVPDLIEYRRKSKDAYAAWSDELDRLSLRLLDVQPERITTETAKTIVNDIQPRLQQYRQDMESARDKMFGELVKSITKWEMPTLSLAYLTSLSLPTAIAAFAAALLPVVPAVVDYVTQTRDHKRRNSLAYLVGLSKL